MRSLGTTNADTELKLGTYVGDGADNRSITGMGANLTVITLGDGDDSVFRCTCEEPGDLARLTLLVDEADCPLGAVRHGEAGLFLQLPGHFTIVALMGVAIVV